MEAGESSYAIRQIPKVQADGKEFAFELRLLKDDKVTTTQLFAAANAPALRKW